MSELTRQDRRILDRTLRERRLSPEELHQAVLRLPDLSERVRRPTDEEAERYRSELLTEQTARAERIVRALERAVAPPAPLVRPVPLAELEADEI